MRRREFISLLGGAAAAWPLAARAQQPAMPVIGFLQRSIARRDRAIWWPRSAEAWAKPAMSRAATSRSNTVGRGQYDRLPALAADLVRRQVAVIVATGGSLAALAAKAATPTIPIVFIHRRRPGPIWPRRQSQPAGRKRHRYELLVQRAGGEATWSCCTSWFPGVSAIGMLVNPNCPDTETEVRDAQEAARALGLKLRSRRQHRATRSTRPLQRLFEQRAGALLCRRRPVLHQPTRSTRRVGGAPCVARDLSLRDFATAGGLMSYGIELADAYRQVGVYAGQFSRAPAADLPSCSRPSSSSSSTSRPPRRSGSTVPPTLLVARRRGDRMREGARQSWRDQPVQVRPR